MGMIAALNYTNEYRTFSDMQNNQFGVYDERNDRSIYLSNSLDNQYNHNARLGAMLNLTLLTADGNNKFQFKNIFNQIGNDRYTSRQGVDEQNNQTRSAEYYYRSRTTYNGQFTGKHTLKSDELDWSLSYSYANTTCLTADATCRTMPWRQERYSSPQATTYQGSGLVSTSISSRLP